MKLKKNERFYYAQSASLRRATPPTAKSWNPLNAKELRRAKQAAIMRSDRSGGALWIGKGSDSDGTAIAVCSMNRENRARAWVDL